MLVAWSAVGAAILGALITWLGVRASKRANQDTRAASQLEARDREVESRDRDIEARDRLLEGRDRFIDQIQEERARTEAQLHEALERVDQLVGQNRALEEENARLRSNRRQ